MTLTRDALTARGIVSSLITIVGASFLAAMLAIAAFNLLHDHHWAYGAIAALFLVLLGLRVRSGIIHLRRYWRDRDAPDADHRFPSD